MRILLAEDEKALSNALVTIFKHNNYSVDAAYDGEQAEELLSADIYDVAVLDVMMPKKDGISVLRDIRRSGSTVPVIILTAKSQTEDKILGLDAGADDYLTKPFVASELLARIRAVTRRRAEAVDVNVTFGDLTLNRSSYEVSANGTAAKLGRKEFQMLEMLMIKKGRVISSERFMEKIWGYEAEAETGVVWVYLSALRKKLASISSKVKIKSNRNLGYFLEYGDD